MIKSGIIFFIVLVTAYGFEISKPRFDFKDYKEMFHGYLLGVGVEEKHMDHLLACLTDQKSLEVHFVEIMDKIDKLDFSNLPLTAELFADLYDVLVLSVVEVDLCAKDNEEYDRLFQKIYHLMPTTIIRRLMLNFISNPQQIFKDIQDAIDNYLAGKFRQLGQDLGDIMRMVLMYKARRPLTLEEYVKLLKGLLKGLNVNNDVEKVLKCVAKVPEAIEIIFEAIETIKHFDIKHIKEFVEAVKKIIVAVKNLLKELGVCAEGVEEIKIIIQKLSNFDLEKVIARIASNFIEIVVAIKEATKAWAKEDFEAFGLKIGEVIYIVLIKTDSELY